jgi:hypothetical protein
MENAIFGDVMLCGSCKNLRFGGTYCRHHQDDKNQRAGKVSSNLQQKHTAKKYYMSSHSCHPDDGGNMFL